MSEPNWVLRAVVDEIHDEQIRKDNNRSGILKENELESALNRPINAYYYDGERDLFILAAQYVFGIARNHAYVDGNKRTAFATAATFLFENNLELKIDEETIIEAIVSVSQNKISIPQLAELFREHSKSVL